MRLRRVHASCVRIFSQISQPIAKITSANGMSVRTSEPSRNANKLKLNAQAAVTAAMIP